MKLEIQIDDDVYRAYQREAGRRKLGVPALLAEQLARFQDFNTRDRIVVVGPEIREKLEELFNRQISTPELLLELVERVAALKIGEVRIPATPQQLEELKRQAEREEKSFEEIARARFEEVAKGYFQNW